MRPLALPALASAAGIALAEAAGPALPLPVPLVLAALALAGLGCWFHRTASACLPALWLSLGALNHLLAQGPEGRHDLRLLSAAEPQLATLRIRLLEPPSVRVVERQGRLAQRSVVRARVEAWQPQGGAWQPARGLVAISSPGSLPPEFHRGRPAEVFGLLKAPEEADAPGLFDYRTHLSRTRIHRHLSTAQPDDWRPVADADPGPPLSERFLPWAHATLARGLPDDHAARLVRGMLLGWRTALTDDVEEPFMRSGTLHVFAISGLHIALLTTTLVQVLRLLRLPRIACGLLSLPFLWFYLAATGWQPSAVRAGVMGTVVVGSWALSRPTDLLNSLAAAALLILVLEPGQLFLAGFQLSFGVVAGIALIAPPVQDWLLARVAFDPLLPDELRPRWQRWLAVPLRATALNLATTLAAWVAALPLTLHHFHLLNPVSLLANLIVVPLSGLALVAGVLSLALGALLPAAAEWTNQSAWLWMQGMIAASEFFARLPGGSWFAANPPWPWWIAYYGLLAAVLAGWASDPRRRAWLAGLTGCVTLAGLGTYGWHTRRPALTILPEAAGIFSREPGWFGGTSLVDSGSPGTARHLTLPFARASGLDRLEDLLLSNATQRFSGGAPGLLDSLRPARLLIADVRHRAASLRRAVEAARSNQIPVVSVAAGARWQGWEVVHPAPGDDSSRADDEAVVLRREMGGLSVWLLSGSGRLAQRRLAERPGEARADVVVIAVPSEGEPLGEPLLARLQPRAILLVGTDYPASTRPSAALRQRLRETGAHVFVTDEAGAVTLRETKEGLRIEPWQGTPLLLPPRPSSGVANQPLPP